METDLAQAIYNSLHVKKQQEEINAATDNQRKKRPQISQQLSSDKADTTTKQIPHYKFTKLKDH